MNSAPTAQWASLYQPISASASANGPRTSGRWGGGSWTIARPTPASPSSAALAAVAFGSPSNLTWLEIRISPGSRPMSEQCP